MKKSTVCSAIILIAIFSFFPCCKKAAGPSAGSAKAEDMLKMLPDDSLGVFVMDFHRAMETETVSKMIQEEKTNKKYQEFIQKTGIDPKKDIFFIVAALKQNEVPKKQQVAAVVNLKYDKDMLLSMIKESDDVSESIEMKEYDGATLYIMKEEDEETGFSFLDDSNIVIGHEKAIQSVIDVMHKKKENVMKNEDLSKLISQAKKDAMFWGVFMVPKEAMESAAAKDKMLSQLKGMRAASLHFDYKNKNILAEISILNVDPEKNQQIAEFLKGLKALGGMLAPDKPEVSELINKIEISSGEDHVKISANIPEELIEKIKPAPKEQE